MVKVDQLMHEREREIGGAGGGGAGVAALSAPRNWRVVVCNWL